MNEAKEKIAIELIQVAFGDKLWKLMNDSRVNEVMANADGNVWIDAVGQGIVNTQIVLSEDKRLSIISAVAGAEGLVCNSENPTLASILPHYGARFQGMIPPVVSAPAFSIRLKATRVFTLDEYFADKILSSVQTQRIKLAVAKRENILIIGGTGSGKTTLANAILGEIAKTGHRILTIEDTPELQCEAPNTVSLFINDDAKFDWRAAVKVGLRIRPDRIVVGEVRDASALDLLKAWNTGHNGGCATVHANGALQGLARIGSLIEEAVPHAPKELIGEAIDLLVHIQRSKNGRIVDEVVEVHGYQHPTKTSAGHYITHAI